MGTFIFVFIFVQPKFTLQSWILSHPFTLHFSKELFHIVKQKTKQTNKKKFSFWALLPPCGPNHPYIDV